MSLFAADANDSSLLPSFTQPEPIVTWEGRQLAEAILYFILFAFSTLGVVTNAFNIRVFFQQGLTSDSNTVCLFALAIADFLGCFFMVPFTMSELVVKYVWDSTVYLSYKYVSTLIFGVPHVVMFRITCLTTVYIAVERCLCVIIPFRVKTLLRPKTAIVTMILLYAVTITSALPLVSNLRMKTQYISAFNSTVVSVYETRHGKEISKYMNLILNTILTPVIAIIVAMATAIMLYKLKKHRQWREKTAVTGNVDKSKDNSGSKLRDTGHGKRDVEVLKLVLVVTCLFLFCISMSLIPGLASAFVPGFSLVGINVHLYALSFIYKFTFDVINSAMNFFFYLKISSRYRTAFNEVFKKQR